MRALVVADIHANLAALRAVLDDATSRGGFDIIWCLGDIVGYGPDPGGCLELLRRYDLLSVAGNHDYAAAGKMDTAEFNDVAAIAAKWTVHQLSPEDKEFLGELPLVATSSPFTLVHGSLRAPLWEYLLDRESASSTFGLLPTRFCLVGHSHIPFVCQENQGEPRFAEFPQDHRFAMGDERCIFNPGGVGQPRDHDPRPSYCVYDSQRMTVERRRVAYDIPATQERMRQARLPWQLIDRLQYGV